MSSSEVINPFMPDGSLISSEDLWHRDSGYATGAERALLVAMLFDGLQNYVHYHDCKLKAGRNRFKEAYYWVQSRDRDYIFSFENVCEALGIDSEYLRVGLGHSVSGDVGGIPAHQVTGDGEILDKPATRTIKIIRQAA